ncbi:uncharacterized protein B0H64DRAFT_439966 [Chaetomium fimeti]|uniref:Uncharacterized protein n=1 Tax=Chaetomium fimeti TaxID=1854472 RepID=A0AAE0HN50_9PEZI|nr:hypothetical protein B0H64DRAFT_439966 [Chaetomium fimeti]
MATVPEPSASHTRAPSSRQDDQIYIPSEENEYELSTAAPIDPPPSYRSRKASTTHDPATALATPPPSQDPNITITHPAPAARPSTSSNPPPYPLPTRNPRRSQAHITDATTTPSPSSTSRQRPSLGDIAWAAVLLLVVLFLALAALFSCTVAVMSIAHPGRVTYENAGAFFARAGYAVVVEVGVLCMVGGVYLCIRRRRACGGVVREGGGG